MTNKLMTSAVIAAALVLGAQVKAAPVDIQVNVASKADARAPIFVGLFKKASSWDAETPDKNIKFPASADGSHHVIDLEPGTYAFFMYNDLNNDGKLETGFMGMPAEPYSFSNNVKINMSKPTWAQISFKVTADGAKQVIRLKN